MANQFDDIITKCSFWEHLTPEQKSLIQANSKQATYNKGTIVHNADEHCMGAIFIKSGTLRAYMLSDEGKEITLYRLYDNDFCILSASCVLRAITFDVIIEAEDVTNVYIIDANTFFNLMKQNVYVENFALNVAVDRFSSVMWSMQQILFMSFEKRLAIFLNDEMSNTGSTILHITHDKIAKYIGSAREVVTRMLKQFADDKLVKLSRGQIEILDKRRLLDLAK